MNESNGRGSAGQGKLARVRRWRRIVCVFAIVVRAAAAPIG
jgi:hypothetical protein